MTQTNQMGDPVEEEVLFPAYAYVEQSDLSAAVSLLCQRLGVEIVRTNATKHGTTELVIREVEG